MAEHQRTRIPQAAVPQAEVARRQPVAHKRAPETEAEGLLSLQRQAGNRATVDLLRLGQAKLEVGEVNDPCELEADHVANRVVSSLGASTGAGPVVAPSIMRTPTAGRSEGSAGTQAESAINAARGGGRPMDNDLRSSMESAFGGADFSGVRLHSGAGAKDLNHQLSARAFTVGGDIFFRDGIPDRGSKGQSLLAHELTHTIQQGASGIRAPEPESPEAAG